MRRNILMIFLTMISLLSYAQNENDYREAYTLKLSVDSNRFYEQKLERTAYFVKGNSLQIYPGEKLLIEVECTGNDLTSMKVVKKNLNPEKTIIINFTQEVKERKSEFMMLEIENPFEKALEYKAYMYVVGHDKWIDTNVLPVSPKLKGI